MLRLFYYDCSAARHLRYGAFNAIPGNQGVIAIGSGTSLIMRYRLLVRANCALLQKSKQAALRLRTTESDSLQDASSGAAQGGARRRLLEQEFQAPENFYALFGFQSVCERPNALTSKAWTRKICPA